MLLLFTSNPFLSLASLLTLVTVVNLLWRKNIPNVILFLGLFHWVQISSAIFLGNFTGEYVDDYFFTENQDTAIYLSLLGLVFMTLIFSAWLNKFRHITPKFIYDASTRISFRKIIIVYLLFFAFHGVLRRFSWSVPGLTQLLFALADLRWSFFVIICWHVLINKSNYKTLAFFSIMEFVSGLGGYFSSFKIVLIYLIIVGLSFFPKVRFKYVIVIFPIIFTLFQLMTSWTAIKYNYRIYVRQGADAQAVTVDRGDALFKMMELYGSLSKSDKDRAVTSTFERASYTYYFAKTIDRIPTLIPFENGKLWLSSLQFNLLPRIFFPDKPSLDASAKTNKYAGFNHRTASEGVSISLGYFTDSYIDFGPMGMYFPIGLIAFFIGFLFYFFMTRNFNLIFNFGIVTVLIFKFIYFETDGTALSGSLIINFAYYLILSFTAYPIVHRYILKK